MDLLSTFVAGFAFFLVGIKLFSSNLNQVSGKKFRSLITKFTPNAFFAALWGMGLSLLTAGNTVLTPCITAGFKTVNAIDYRKCIHIVTWSRVGSCAFIYVAGYNIVALVLILMGVAGISYALNKPKRYANFALSVFYLGLVLVGINFIKESTKPLTHLDWFNTIIQYTQQYPEIAFIAGFIFILFAQSLFASLVVAISFLESGVFNYDQVLLFTYGTYLGEGLLKIFYMTAFKGAFKQVMFLLPITYFLCFFIGIADHFLEATFQLPLLESWAKSLGSNPQQSFAHINFFIHLITVTLISLNASSVEKLMLKILGEEEQVEMAPVEIPTAILEEPSVTMAIIEKEELRLVGHFPAYIETIRKKHGLSEMEIHSQLHGFLKRNLEVIHDVFAELLRNSHYHPEIADKLILNIERLSLLNSLEENLFKFSNIIESLRRATLSKPEITEKFLNFAEATDATLLTLMDVMHEPKESFNQLALNQITTSREEFIKELRTEYSNSLAAPQKAELALLVNLFESNLWIIQRVSNLTIQLSEDG